MAETLPSDEFAIDAGVKGAICGTFATARAGCETLFMLGSIRMKKIAFVVAAAGLMTLAACNSNPAADAVENNADVVADNLEMQADNLDAMADDASNAAVADTLENAADNANAAADNVRDSADAVADNLQ